MGSLPKNRYMRIFEIVQHGDEERTNHVRVVFRHIVIHEAVMVYVTGIACMGTFNGFMCGRILDLESSGKKDEGMCDRRNGTRVQLMPNHHNKKRAKKRRAGNNLCFL